jgi:hypothetical protein
MDKDGLSLLDIQLRSWVAEGREGIGSGLCRVGHPFKQGRP